MLKFSHFITVVVAEDVDLVVVVVAVALIFSKDSFYPRYTSNKIDWIIIIFCVSAIHLCLPSLPLPPSLPTVCDNTHFTSYFSNLEKCGWIYAGRG